MPQRLADDVQTGSGDGLITAHCAAQVMDTQVFNIRTFQQCIPCPVGFCVGWRGCAGRAGFILVGVHKSNPIPPHAPKHTKM